MGPRRHDVVWTEGARRELDAAIHKIIHRDIKPANILIHEGRPLIADFGIALAVGVAGGGCLTETGLSVGTPHYMSPEQATGDQAVGVATDIYALGAVLFEMLIGDPPYTGSTAQAILGKIIQGKLASATEERASVPPNVDAAIHKALEKLPADRFATAATAAAFAEALANPGFVLPRTAEATVETESPARTGRPLAVAVAGAAAIALLSFFAGRATTPEPTGALARFTVPAAESLSAVSACCGPAQTLSPDGEWFVYVGVSGVGGATMLYRRRLGQLEAEGIPGTEGASSPFFSPDGLSVGFHSDGRIRRVSISGGSPVTVTEISRIDGGSWGDNGLIVFTTFGEEGANLYTVPAAGGEPTPVPSDAAERRMYSWMLPGGDAALVRAGTSRESRIIAVDLMTGREDTLGFGTLAAYASGYLVTTSPDGTLLAQPFDPRRRRTTGPAVALLDGVSLAGPEVGEFTLSVNGTLAYVRGGRGRGEHEYPGGPRPRWPRGRAAHDDGHRRLRSRSTERCV